MKTNILRSIKSLFDLSEDKGDEIEVIDAIKRGVEFKGTNLWTLIFAIIIASVGLNVNSTAVIIGAMLISPLMGPIMGIGLGAGILDIPLIKDAFKNLALATLIALVTSSLYFFISPISTAQSELLARTTPTIWDVLIAFFGGLAGIVAFSRKKFSNVIPGVAIATALMPPLCTAGFGIGTGQWSYFIGAFYLFIINSVFISIATFLMVRFLKFHAITYEDQNLKRRVQKWVGYIALLTIVPSIFMAYKFVGEEFFKQRLQNYINIELKAKNILVINKQVDAIEKSAKLFVLGDKVNDSIIKILLDERVKYGLESFQIEILNAYHDKADIDVNEIKSSIVEDLFKNQQEELKAKTIELEKLKRQSNSKTSNAKNQRQVIEEFKAIFGEQDKISFSDCQQFDKNNKPDSILLVVIKPIKSISNSETKKIENWIKLRLNKKQVQVIIEK